MTHERGWPWEEPEETPTSTETTREREQGSEQGPEQGMDFPSPDPWRPQDDGSAAESPMGAPMSDPAVMERQAETAAPAKKSVATRKRSVAKKPRPPKTTARK